MFNFIYYLGGVVIGLFFLLLGLIAIILPWSIGLRTDVVLFFLENSIAISLFGFGFFLIGIGMLVNFYLSSRRSSYRLHSKQPVVIDQRIMEQYLTSYWKQLFPQQEIPTQLFLRKNRLKITADLPYVPLLEQKPLVEQIEKDLQEIFSNLLGYSESFALALSFAKK